MRRAAYHIIFAEIKNTNVVINCDSQAAIIALDNTKTTLDAAWCLRIWEKTTRYSLDGSQLIAAMWVIQNRHSCQKGANNIDATLPKLPIRKLLGSVAIIDVT